MRHGDLFPILFVGLLVLSGFACTPPEQIYSGMNLMFFDAGGDIFVAEGKWQRVGQERTVLVPDVNSVRIECYRPQGFCDEYIAKFITPADDETKTTQGKSLFLMKQTFRITEWNQERISASADPRAADLSLRISLRVELRNDRHDGRRREVRRWKIPPWCITGCSRP